MNVNNHMIHTYPNAYRAMIIWRIPSLGPQVVLYIVEPRIFGAPDIWGNAQVRREGTAEQVEEQDNKACIAQS